VFRIVRVVEEAADPFQPRIETGLTEVKGWFSNSMCYRLHYIRYAGAGDKQQYIANILHEMMHVTAGIDYQKAPIISTVDDEVFRALEFSNFSIAATPLLPTGTDEEKYNAIRGSLDAQLVLTNANWLLLAQTLNADNGISPQLRGYLNARIAYAREGMNRETHYDTVLLDMLYYMKSKNIQDTVSYRAVKNMLNEANTQRNTMPRQHQPVTAMTPAILAQ
jgi:hypothetical protein